MNETTYAARMVRGATGPREMLASVVVKQTYRPQGEVLILEPELGWPIFDQPFDFDGVAFQPDGDFRKSALDIILFGAATSPNGDPVDRVDTILESGNFRVAATVFGDRVWERGRSGALRRSEPLPFVELPLGNARSFGGHAPFAEGTVADMNNPEGRGFYLSEEDADNQPLANIEHTEAPVAAWTDRPRPICFHKPAGLELAPDEISATGRDLMSPARLQAMFSSAARDFRTDAASLGDHLTLTGLLPGGPATIPLPPKQGPICDVTVGTLRSHVASGLSMLVVLTRPLALVATYTAHFRYLFSPHEPRQTVLR